MGRGEHAIQEMVIEGEVGLTKNEVGNKEATKKTSAVRGWERPVIS